MSAGGRREAEVRVALVGYGLAGAVFHAPLVRATPAMRLKTVVTANPARAAAAAGLGDVQVRSTVDAVLDDPSGHELLVIATPNASHASLARAGLEAGLHVIVDKPLAPSLAEAASIAELAGSRGGRLTVFHNRRWDGDFLTVRALVESGRLGGVLRFESRFERWRPRPGPGSWRDQAGPGGGGILLDLGSHLVDQAVQLFGRPLTVSGEVRAVRPGAVVDDDVFIALAHRGGTISHLWASLTAPVPGPRFRVLGESGGYEKLGLDVQEEALRDGGDAASPSWGTESAERWGRLVTEDGEERLQTLPGAWPAFYRGVVTWIREGGPPPVTPGSAVEVLEILEAARAAAAGGSSVSLPPV